MTACSTEPVWIRPIQNSPLGISTILGGVCSTWAKVDERGSTSHTVSRTLHPRKTGHPRFKEPVLDEQVLEIIGRNKIVGSDGRRLNIFVGTAGRRVLNLLSPVDTQRGVDRRHQVVDGRTFAVIPAIFNALGAVFVGL